MKGKATLPMQALAGENLPVMVVVILILFV